MKKEIKPIFKIDWSQPYQAIVKITPEDAKKILDGYNNGNRYLRAGGARYIAVQIKSGEWVEDHPQPICFSNEGKLIDGQHRMAGIALAGIPVWATARFGVNPSVMKYMDTGISRALYDRVYFVENPTVNKFIAAMVTEKHQMKIKGKVTPETALSMYYEMEESYRIIAENRGGKRHVGTAVVGLAFADYHQRHGNEAVVMYRELYKNTTDCQPAQALLHFLTNSKSRGAVQYPYIVGACLANHEGRRISKLYGRSWG
jgi:hypothetical protein